jgi:hypothetical protein
LTGEVAPINRFIVVAMAPRISRSRAVIDYCPSSYKAYVYDEVIAADGSSTVLPLDRSSNTTKIQRFTSMSVEDSHTGDERNTGEVDAGPRGCTRFLVAFWVDETHQPCYQVHLNVPGDWTPRLYLAMMNLTIRKYQCIISSPKKVLGGYTQTLNSVHWLFHRHVPYVMHLLSEEHAFRFIYGGDEKKLDEQDIDNRSYYELRF